MKKLNFLAVVVSTLLLFNGHAEARRHKKFKGVIIVNQILKLDGTIKRNGEDAPEFSGVKQGDVLETGEKSRAVIRIPGLAILRMGPKTKLTLTQFNNRDSSRFALASGDLLALFRRYGDHEIILNHGMVKVQGTTFYVLSPPEGKADELCLCDGKIKVVANGGVKDEPAIQAVATATTAPTAVSVPSVTPGQDAVPAPTGSPTLNSTPMPSPKPTPTPTPTPAKALLPHELQIVSTGEHKQCEISDDGVELKPKNGLMDLHSQIEIKDLESLYALP